MRTKNSIKNASVSVLISIVTILLGFLSQSIFIKTLGTEYVGVKGLFSNILSMLALFELGIGSAIVFNLYKPLAEKDEKLIKSLTYFYKKIYTIIGIIILIIGIGIMPFIPQIVKTTTVTESLYLIFFLYLLDSLCSYFFTYKRSILYADQKNYVINIVNILCALVLNIAQITVLLITKNFILYIIIKIIFRLLENIIILRIVDKKYPYLKNMKDSEPIPVDIKKDITKKVKGLIFHKVGFYVLQSTDNILISMSKGLGIIYVGLYTNYNMIITYVSSIFGNIFASLTASVGNLLTEKNTEKSLEIYKSMLLLNNWIMGFCAISIFCLTEPVIKIWIGGEYLLPKFVLFVLTINFYIQGMRKTTNTFKDASGVFYEDRFIPIIESILNLGFSILFLKIYGLAGVFMGTIASTSIIYLYSYPKFVYIGVLKGTYWDYIKLYLENILVFGFVFVATYLLTKICSVDNNLIQILINVIICGLFANLLFFLIFRKNKHFDFYRKNILNKMVDKFCEKSETLKIFISKYRKYNFKVAFSDFLEARIRKPKILRKVFIKYKQDQIIKYLKKQNINIIKKYKSIDEKPLNIPKYIYVFWWQGMNEAPEIVKACLKSLKRNSEGFKVNVIDKNNYDEYVNINSNILSKLERGIITLTHFSDILRFNLLNQRGGIWVDATIFFTDNPFKDFINKKVNSYKFNEEKYYEYVSKAKWTGFFIGSGKDSVISNFIVDVFNNYWSNHDEMIDYFLIDYSLELGYRYIPKIRKDIDNIEIRNEDMYELCKIISQKYDESKYNELIKDNKVHKLSYKVKLEKFDKENNETFYNKITNKK